MIGVAFLICAWNPAEPGDIVCELAEYAVAITSAPAKNAITNFCMLISDSMQEGEFSLSAGRYSINVTVAFDCYPIVIGLLSGRWRRKRWHRSWRAGGLFGEGMRACLAGLQVCVKKLAESVDLMRYLATILAGLIVIAPAWANKLDTVLQQAEALGAPMAAVQRAIEISRQPAFVKKDVLAVFDISQPSKNKRFYVLDFKAGQVTAHYAAHGKHNGPGAKATKFKGFQTDLDMVPLGPLKTEHSIELDPYKTIVDRYDGTIYRNMIVVVLDGVTSYNSYINDNPPFKWVIHPSWYTTAAFRAKNSGGLGRSDGCIVLDPAESNELITRLEDGALVYVTVGDDPIEKFL
jgi:hypothetical protein